MAREGLGDQLGLPAASRRGDDAPVNCQEVDHSSGTIGPREDIVNERSETRICVRQIGADDVAGNVLHPRDGLEPPGLFRPRGLSEDQAALRRDAVDMLQLGQFQIFAFCDADLMCSLTNSSPCSSTARSINLPTPSSVRLKNSSSSSARPSRHVTTSPPSLKRCFHAFGRLLVIVPDDGDPISQGTERGSTLEGSVGVTAAAIHEGCPLGGNGVVAVGCPILIETTHKADLAGTFADDDEGARKASGYRRIVLWMSSAVPTVGTSCLSAEGRVTNSWLPASSRSATGECVVMNT